MNIRQELEALRDEVAKAHVTISSSIPRERSSYANCLRGQASVYKQMVNKLDALIQRIPDGWELRPREPSAGMIEASWREAAVASPNAWRAMWDEAGGGEDE